MGAGGYDALNLETVEETTEHTKSIIKLGISQSQATYAYIEYLLS